MRRRTFLSGVGAAVSAVSGCAGVEVESRSDGAAQPSQEPSGTASGLDLSLEEDSKYFESVEYVVEEGVFIFPGVTELVISLRPEPPKTVSAIVLMVDGEQSDAEGIDTGELRVTFDLRLEDKENINRELEVIAIKGGDLGWGTWEGGEILDRVALTVE